MKRIGILMLLSFVFICLGCPDECENCHQYIIFVNNSNSDIACQRFWSGHITEADTLYQCGIGAVGIPSDSSCNFSSFNDSGWETDFRAIPYIQFLVMDREVYWQYRLEPCDSIRKYVPILHCYRLTLEDLQRMNWTVVYPPEE